MSDTVIQVENLSKRYVIGHQKQERYSTLRDAIANSAKSLKHKIFNSNQKFEDPSYEEFWALKDVSFEIKRGDRVGIIGRNGAGKSTLLKILSRITEPTSGRISIKGRVASLLEVGTGFHQELTGRENIFLNGAILGMSRAEIRKKFDEIVDFAEVENFLDTPVKHYSSGMYVRLAFAVAAHLEPEILIVDEVLAVGDIEFQKKCLGKMGDISQKSEKTVLFVSHNMSAIRRLCSRSILIDKGNIKSDGRTYKVLDNYLKEFFVSNQSLWIGQDRLGNNLFKLNIVKLRNSLGEYTSSINISESAFVDIFFTITEKGAKIQFAITVTNSNDECVFSSLSNLDTKYHNQPLDIGEYVSSCCIYGDLLNSGNYYISLNIGHETFNESIIVNNVLKFNAIDDGTLKGDYIGDFGGDIRPKLKWQTQKIDKSISNN